MKIVFRPHYNDFDTERFHAACTKILDTQYRSGAKDADAPGFTDCVTAVRWIFRQSSDYIVPHSYIGDLPNTLDPSCGIFPLSEARIGDIIFFEKMSKTHKKYMVTHVGIMIDKENFIHSSLKENGKISSIHDIAYTDSILHESFLSLATDPRNNA